MQYAHRFFERRKGRTKINSDSTPSFGHILFLTHTIQIYALDISTFSNKRAGRMTVVVPPAEGRKAASSQGLCFACDRCRKHKRKCDGKQPCKRCLESHAKNRKRSYIGWLDTECVDCVYSPAKRRGPLPGKAAAAKKATNALSVGLAAREANLRAAVIELAMARTIGSDEGGFVRIPNAPVMPVLPPSGDVVELQRLLLIQKDLEDKMAQIAGMGGPGAASSTTVSDMRELGIPSSVWKRYGQNLIRMQQQQDNMRSGAFRQLKDGSESRSRSQAGPPMPDARAGELTDRLKQQLLHLKSAHLLHHQIAQRRLLEHRLLQLQILQQQHIKRHINKSNRRICSSRPLLMGRSASPWCSWRKEASLELTSARGGRPASRKSLGGTYASCQSPATTAAA